MLFFVFCNLISFVSILLSIAFYTLFERKILGLSQLRVGPNKLSIFGLVQPLIDGLKLIIKEFSMNDMVLKVKFYFFPSFLFLFMILLWSIMPSKYFVFSFVTEFLFFLLILGLMIFFVLILSIESKSKFAFLGAMRAACQSVSYEISLSFLLMCPLCICFSLDFNMFFFFGFSFSIFIFFLWWTICLMECNRAPFDFAEGESELISGFNVEYSSVGFVFIFLSEYGMMLFFSFFSSILFFNNLFFFFLLFFSFISIRTSYPRYRYDKLMFFCWLIVLPLSIFFYFIFLIF